MNRCATIFLAATLMLMGQSPVLARNKIDIDGLGALAHYPGAPKPVQQTDDNDSKSPYPMSYSDEAAQNLGVRNGRMEFFNTGSQDSGLAPALTGGVDGGGAMLKLQWHPGE